MATVKIEGLSPEFENLNGSLEITRRLSDKVLAVFNHAYATGEREVAKKLRSVLQMTEAKRPKSDKRTSYNAVEHADLWVGSVTRITTSAPRKVQRNPIWTRRSTQRKTTTVPGARLRGFSGSVIPAKAGISCRIFQ